MLTSTLAFNITQFFSSLNHCLLSLILDKAGFRSKVINFFSNYLINRKTAYSWNSFLSHLFNVNMRMGQGSALSPILSALYFSPFLYILEKCLKNLNLKSSILSFVDDSLLISQGKSFQLSNTQLFSSYNIASKLLSKFSFLVEHSKTEVFYFPDPIAFSILSSLKSNQLLAALHSSKRISGDTWALSLIKNYIFVSISTFMPTKPSLQSNA